MGACHCEPARRRRHPATRFFHTDHLGSLAAITNESVTMLERLSHIAWGKRRNSNGADGTDRTVKGVNNKRGFTPHEPLDATALAP